MIDFSIRSNGGIIMSKGSMLEAIRKAERIADMLWDCNSREAESLGGQATGALSAVVYELKSYGIDTDNPMIQKAADRLAKSGKVDEAVSVIHLTSGYLRALVNRL